jgi:hypothetical protein
VLDLAPFATAVPQLGHQLLALLLAEDAIRLLLTNWDDCVERSWRRIEHIPAARNELEAELLRGQFALKIHGCCTQPETLLITSAQLNEPPLWTKIYFQAELAQSTMVFVGIGDVADYAQQRITELAGLVPHARVRIVSPGIVANWDTSAWKALLPDVPDERRIPKSGDAFLDELAREWVMTLVGELKGPAGTTPPQWVTAVVLAFTQLTALEALAWLRRAAVGWKVGESVVRSAVTISALEAIALLARGDAGAALATVRFLGGSAVAIGEERLEVVVCRDRLTSSDVEAIVADRAGRVVGRVGPLEEVHMLVAASSVRGPKPRELVGIDVVDPDATPDELIGGEQHVSIRLTWVDEVLEAA